MILFVHIEKSAGTSLSSYLKSKFGCKFIDLYPIDNGKFVSDKDIDDAILFNKSPFVLSSHKIQLDKINLDRFSKVVVTVRDSYERFQSHFNHLKELGKLKNVDFDECINLGVLNNLQYYKLGGVNSFKIINSLVEQNKLLLFKKNTFKEDIAFFVSEDIETPFVNVRKKKIISSTEIEVSKESFNKKNIEELKLISFLNELNTHTEKNKNFLEFSNLKTDSKNIDRSNFYRKFYRIPLLILKSMFFKGRLFKRFNMEGVYYKKKLDA